MTKFILHGGGESNWNSKNEKFFQKFIELLPDQAKILLVYFAITEEETREKHPFYEKHLNELVGDKKIELKVATKENFIEELKWADGVYFRGGETDRLLEAAKQYPNFKEELLKKELVAGSSAGVYFLSNYSISSSRDVIYEGLGILPIKTNCHWSPEKEGVEDALKEYPGKLILLQEGEFCVLEE